MTPRATGAAFGLLAFSITIIAGLSVRNPSALILQRAIWAMLVFCFIGLSVGWAAQVVVREHFKQREEAMFTEDHPTSDQSDVQVEQKELTESDALPMRT